MFSGRVLQFLGSFLSFNFFVSLLCGIFFSSPYMSSLSEMRRVEQVPLNKLGEEGEEGVTIYSCKVLGKGVHNLLFQRLDIP